MKLTATMQKRAENAAADFMGEFFPEVRAREKHSISRPITKLVEWAFIVQQLEWDCHDHGIPDWPFTAMREGDRTFAGQSGKPQDYAPAILLREAVKLAEAQQ